jgi:hypothetical protein
MVQGGVVIEAKIAAKPDECSSHGCNGNL